MSVIVRNIETNEIISFVKGADNAIIPRIIGKCEKYQDLNTVEGMEKLSDEGLRTLMFGKKVIK
jgi:magnesium-transporting ATPase (P-type)